MTERDAQIIELSRSGLSAKKIRERLNLSISIRRVQNIIRKELGTVKRSSYSKANALYHLRPLVFYCMTELLGKDPRVCEVCREHQDKLCEIHHTKYEGATLYDLQFVCRSCNLARNGQGIT